MEKGFYHKDFGYWQTVGGEPSDEIKKSYPEGTIEVPPMPGRGYKFNGTEWIAPTQDEINAERAQMFRDKRSMLLRSVVDPIVTNPFRWADLTEDKKTEWINYRQALLDITSQPEFPIRVTWPTQPQN
jgi:hypothetical protein